MDDIDRLIAGSKCVWEAFQGLSKVMLLMLAKRLRARYKASPKVDGVHKDRVSLFGGREAQAVTKPAQMDLETTLPTVWGKYVQPRRSS